MCCAKFHVWQGFVLFVVDFGINTVTEALLCWICKADTWSYAKNIPISELKKVLVFLLFRFRAVRCRVLWPLDRTVDGPQTTLDVCCFLETKWAVLGPLNVVYGKLWLVCFKLLYYYEASVQNNMALLTCISEDPFRISHGTRTIFTEVFLGFPHSVKANVGKAL